MPTPRRNAETDLAPADRERIRKLAARFEQEDADAGLTAGDQFLEDTLFRVTAPMSSFPSNLDTQGDTRLPAPLRARPHAAIPEKTRLAIGEVVRLLRGYRKPHASLPLVQVDDVGQATVDQFVAFASFLEEAEKWRRQTTVDAAEAKNNFEMQAVLVRKGEEIAAVTRQHEADAASAAARRQKFLDDFSPEAREALLAGRPALTPPADLPEEQMDDDARHRAMYERGEFSQAVSAAIGAYRRDGMPLDAAVARAKADAAEHVGQIIYTSKNGVRSGVERI